MDNRINEIRRKISLLRGKTLELETLVRNQIGKGLDCAEAAGEQLEARKEIARLIGEWKAAGGGDRLPDPGSPKRVSKREELRLRVLAARA
ncbi:hypothetical protein JQ628_26365 [Bradyrhizobium lablabi]|uniref:hypothetical protein n=1 Tax=Bradyrhizobium lablabi TaxID=722472 RepID=UPI001BAD5202|nr:hypothetical protein [Bradyrhizobium lablabi]MBR1125072.1 hypothetical protein [Bradyrhizobium lablabi]